MDYEAKFRQRDQAARVIQAAWRGHKQENAFRRLQDAVRLIQSRMRVWNAKRRVQKAREKHAKDDRFQALMQRHRERIQVLETEKRVVMRLPAGELDDWEMKRIRAASVVQAHWRGLVQRRKMAKSPERLQREKAALRIQGAFKSFLTARRSTASGLLTQSHSLSFGHSPQSLRQSGASVLIGSPSLRASTASVLGGGTATAVGGGGAAGPMRSSTAVMSIKRARELENQIKGRVEAYKALSKGRGRPDPRQVSDRLSTLLSHYNNSAPGRIAAAHLRQRNLMLMDTLCGQLDQVRPLAELGDSIQPHDFPRPPRGSERAERASQAHALMLAEARVGSKWWTHLKGLNKQAVQAALLAEDEERWEALNSEWKRSWEQIQAEEDQRRDIILEERAARGHSHGALAVQEAKKAAAHEAQKAMYTARVSASSPGPNNNNNGTSVARIGVAPASPTYLSGAGAVQRASGPGARGGGAGGAASVPPPAPAPAYIGSMGAAQPGTVHSRQ